MHVVHTFNADRSKEGTVEELPDSLAKTLLNTGRAREASEEEIALGRVAPTEPPADEPAATAAPTTPPGTLAADTAPQLAEPATVQPEPTASADSAPATSKAEAKKASGPTPPSTSSSTPAK